jgi:EAL domain-containing protein (putative c-di-GMP-specific phosphodiesterase class I)
VEALARWQHPTRGLLSPDDFIPLAEETGLITRLGTRLLDRALSQASVWLRTGQKTAVAVNLSVIQLSDPDFPEELHEALGRHGVPAELVLVEVTETGVMERLDAARSSLERIASQGVRVLIDDFGTGYSSIARLRELPVVGVKVDRAFTRSLGEDPSVDTVLAAITNLAHALDLRVVAEGIETGLALARATELGCDFVQGFEVGRPGSSEEVEALLRSGGRPGAWKSGPSTGWAEGVKRRGSTGRVPGSWFSAVSEPFEKSPYYGRIDRAIPRAWAPVSRRTEQPSPRRCASGSAHRIRARAVT